MRWWWINSIHSINKKSEEWEWTRSILKPNSLLASSTLTSTCASSGATPRGGKRPTTSSSGGPRAGEVLHRNTVGGPGNCSDLHRPRPAAASSRSLHPCSPGSWGVDLRVSHGAERPRAVHGWGPGPQLLEVRGGSKGRRHVVVKTLKRLPVRQY